VVAGRLVENARAVLDAAPLGVIGPKIDSPQARERDRRRAHRAWLERDVEIAIEQTLGLKRRTSTPDRDDLRVRGWIEQCARFIASAGQHSAVGADDHRTNRNLAAHGRRPCLLKRKFHRGCASYHRHALSIVDCVVSRNARLHAGARKNGAPRGAVA
jgi:hypothetical protein